LFRYCIVTSKNLHCNAPAGLVHITTKSANIDVCVSVFGGDCTNGLYCVHSNGGGSVIDWMAKANTPYYIAVYGCCGPQAQGSFLMKIDTVEAGTPCTNAINLGSIPADGLTWIGDTLEGKALMLDSCGALHRL